MHSSILKSNRKVIAISVTCLFGWLFTFLAVSIFRQYAFGLFIWLPIVLGVLTTLIYGYKYEVTKVELRSASFIALGIFCLGLLAFAFEGIICIVMAAPIGLFFTWCGHLLAFEIIKSQKNSNQLVAMLAFIVSVPVLMGWEHGQSIGEDLRFVTTSVEINAKPEVVWKNIIQFPKMKYPDELIFKMGIAYPISAEIDGMGVGAVRHCDFSTGSFLEPITAWREAELLKFDVLDQPEPMKEISPYDIHPNHLHGYWVSKRGEFKLTPLANNRTLLEGTTWYVNKIKPTFYWSFWSDNIVHAIHSRVLQHIKKLSEN